MKKILLLTALLLALVSIDYSWGRVDSFTHADSYCLIAEASAGNAEEEYSQPEEMEGAVCFSSLYNVKSESTVFTPAGSYPVMPPVKGKIFQPPRNC